MTAPYVGIADQIAARIHSGALRPGDRVPSTRAITRSYGVAIATATKALSELGTRGLVHAIPGVGTVVGPAPGVARRAPTAGTTATAPPTALNGERRRPISEPDRQMRARIIEAAVRIADAEGMAAVTMRRIAITLDMPTMSLYRWVPGKDSLVDGMLDAVLGRGDWPDPPAGWRAQLEYIARRQWADYQQHPWASQVISLSRPQMATEAMMHTEWALRAISGFPLDPTTRFMIVLTVFGHVKAAAATLDADRIAEQETGLTNDAWVDASDAAFTEVIQSGRYPNLARLDGDTDIDLNAEAMFEFGLTALLDGIANVLATPRPAPITLLG